MSNITGSLNSLIWLLFLVLVIAAVVWVIRAALAPRGGGYRERTVVQQAPPQPAPSSGLVPGWYPDQNDHNRMRYYDGRVWTSETRHA